MNIHSTPNAPTTDDVTTGPLPASTKVYVSPDGHPDVRVPLREIELEPSAMEPPVRVYDTSGVYSDPNVTIDIEAGLPRTRTAWSKALGGVADYEGRDVKPEDNGNVSEGALARAFPVVNRPLAGDGSKPLTQYQCAKAGIITKEMEYVALRENIGRKKALEDAAQDVALGESFGADIPEFITAEFVREEIARGRAIIPAN
ncbi:MAG: phosphomethylpyrimidine synthase ThiC, partial [Pseudomonadota bacterium]